MFVNYRNVALGLVFLLGMIPAAFSDVTPMERVWTDPDKFWAENQSEIANGFISVETITAFLAGYAIDDGYLESSSSVDEKQLHVYALKQFHGLDSKTRITRDEFVKIEKDSGWWIIKIDSEAVVSQQAHQLEQTEKVQSIEVDELRKEISVLKKAYDQQRENFKTVELELSNLRSNVSSDNSSEITEIRNQLAVMKEAQADALVRDGATRRAAALELRRVNKELLESQGGKWAQTYKSM